MGHAVRTNGDYTIKTKESGNILLDTGDNLGNVIVTGNLIVSGDTLTVAAENLNITDNIIELNVGDPGPGVTLKYSGVQINRGTSFGSPLPGGFFLDDRDILDPTWIFIIGDPESPRPFQNSSIKVRTIKTDSDEDGGDLTLIGKGTGVIKVTGTTNYQNQVIDDDHIPNKKYVDNAIINNPSFQSVAGDSRISVTDKDLPAGSPGSPDFFLSTGWSTFNRSAVSVIIDGVLVSQFYDDSFLLGRPGQGGLRIDSTNFEIRTEDGSPQAQNIFIKTDEGGKLQTNYGIQLDHITANPSFAPNGTIVFGKAPKEGTSGIFFTNSLYANEELVSKKRALLFSMLF
jgi:hypothetical protein